MLNTNVPAWFEIPVNQLDRAQKFYETIFDVKLQRQNMGGGDLAVFPYGGRPNASGALIQHADYEPSVLGSIVYISVDNLDPVLARANLHGGDTLMPRTQLPNGIGYFAQFVDCEGNRVGLFSPD